MPADKQSRQVERQERDYELFSPKNWRLYKQTQNGKLFAEQLREDPNLAVIQKRIYHRLFELFVLYSLENSWIPKMLGVGVTAWLGGMKGGLSAWLGDVPGGEHMDAMLGVVGGAIGGQIASLGASQIARVRVGFYSKNYTQVMMHCLGDLISRIEREEVTGTFAEHVDRFQPCLSSVPLVSFRRVLGNFWVVTHSIDSIQQLARKIVRNCLRTSKALKREVRQAKVHAWQTKKEKRHSHTKKIEEVEKQTVETAQTADELRERQRMQGILLNLVAGQVAKRTGSSGSLPAVSVEDTVGESQMDGQKKLQEPVENEIMI